MLLDSDGDAPLHGCRGSRRRGTEPAGSRETRIAHASTRQHFFEGAERIGAMERDTVLSHLEAGQWSAKGGGGLHEVIPPRIDVVRPIGSGDAMAAAFVWATAKNKPFTDAVRCLWLRGR